MKEKTDKVSRNSVMVRNRDKSVATAASRPLVKVSQSVLYWSVELWWCL